MTTKQSWTPGRLEVRYGAQVVHLYDTAAKGASAKLITLPQSPENIAFVKRQSLAPEMAEALRDAKQNILLFYDSSEKDDATMVGVGECLDRINAVLAKLDGAT